MWRVVCVFLAVFLSGAGAASADGPVKIGALTESWGPTPAVVGLRDGLLALGYREDVDFTIGVRFTQGDLQALYPAARELVRFGVDIIFCSGAQAAKAAQEATDTIPIVFASTSDPIGRGLIQSFARPGGNITGLTDLDLALAPKRLEVFRALIPGMKRVLFAYNASSDYARHTGKAYREAAHRLGIILQERALGSEEEARATLTRIRNGEVDGILAPFNPDLNIPGLILEATAKQGIPSMFGFAFMVDQGGLASYGPSLFESGRLAARLVDKIMRGVKPAEIPVEVNTKIEFVINLKVAKALGLEIAPEVLYQADRLIR
ncbi:MAG: ABC transporter substrate-binding protein [SAR324 cluster bacterium]|nr:ABC transporter substrate-binding protein [SAR324 cluster bacterium]